MDQEADYTSSKMSRDAWTDMRIEQIKKKYQTPSSNNKKSNQYYIPRTKYPESYHRTDFNSSNYQSKHQNLSIDNYADDENIPSFGVQSKEIIELQKPQSNYKPIPYYKSYRDPNIKSTSQSYLYTKTQNSVHRTHKRDQLYSNTKSNQFNSRQWQPRGLHTELKQISNYRQYPQNKIEPRVKNIDKINSKIKQILDCLQDNDKYVQNNLGMDNKKSLFTKQFDVLSRGQNSQEFEETKILSRQKINDRSYENKRKMINLSQQGSSLRESPQPLNRMLEFRAHDSKNTMKNSKDLSQNPNKRRQSRQTNCNDRHQHTKTHFDWFQQRTDGINRSKSCLGGFKTDSHELMLNSGKKVDDQINKLNQRIKKFQEQKKKMNIQFKPYEITNRNTRSTSNLSKIMPSLSRPPLPKPRQSDPEHKIRKSELYPHSKYRIRTENINNQLQQQIPFSKEGHQRNLQSIAGKYSQDRVDTPYLKTYQEADEKCQQQLTQKLLFRNPSFQRDINETQLKNTDSVFSSQSKKTSNKEEKDNEEEAKHHFNQQITNKAYQGIENRKQKLLNLETATATFARETKRFIESLFQQAKLDEELRNAKIWFRDFYNEQNKWKQLEDMLNSRDQTVINLRGQFQITEEEDNPFYSVRQNPNNCTLESLVKNWLNADRYWKQHILYQYQLSQFKAEKFTSEKIDMEKKGYFSVEDLVRFLNMETGTFYRNRDLILIFRRLTKGTKLDWDSFMSLLVKSKQQLQSQDIKGEQEKQNEDQF